MKSEIEKATTVQQGLAEIGLPKLAQLVRFIQDFESLEFDANQVKRLAMWHRQLQELHINPDELGKYIAEKGPLEAQNNNLRLTNEGIVADIKANAARRAILQAENSALPVINLVLRTGILTVRCKSCGHSMQIGLPSQESFWNLINTRQVLIFRCQDCGTSQSFTPWEIAFQIAWMFLPASYRLD